MKRIGDIVQVVHPQLGVLAGIVLGSAISEGNGEILSVRVFGQHGTDTTMHRLGRSDFAEVDEPGWREVQ